jgi:hypothetical protein
MVSGCGSASDIANRARHPQERVSNESFVPGAAGMQFALSSAELEAHSIVFEFPRQRPSAKPKKLHDRQKQAKPECPSGFEINANGKGQDKPTRENCDFAREHQKSLDRPHRGNRGMSILSPYFGGWAEGGPAAGFGCLLEAVGQLQQHWLAIGCAEK